MDEYIDDLDLMDLDVTDIGLSDLRNVKGIEYPCALIGNVYVVDVLPLVNVMDCESSRRFPAWIFVDGTFEQIGGISLTFDTVFLMRQLGLSLTIYENEETIESLNLHNLDILEKFI